MYIFGAKDGRNYLYPIRLGFCQARHQEPACEKRQPGNLPGDDRWVVVILIHSYHFAVPKCTVWSPATVGIFIANLHFMIAIKQGILCQKNSVFSRDDEFVRHQ